MPLTLNQRLDRLAGNGKNGGGGLPLPILFHGLLEKLMDDGPQPIDILVGVVEKAVWKPSRVKTLYPDDGYRGLTEDALAALDKRALTHAGDEGCWALSPDFAAGKPRVVIPVRKGKNSNKTVVTIYPKEERGRRSLQSRNERELLSMYRQLCDGVTVFDARDKKGEKLKKYTIHPMAQKFPILPWPEFVKVAASVQSWGLLEPITLFEDQVLDGRHRLAIVSAYRNTQEVRVTKTIDPMPALYQMNLPRPGRNLRKLPMSRKAVMVWEDFVPQAQAEARERMEAGVSKDGTAGGRGKTLLHGGATGRSEGEALEVASERSGNLIGKSALYKFKPVLEAPETLARIKAGDKAVRTIPQALEAAMQELRGG